MCTLCRIPYLRARGVSEARLWCFGLAKAGIIHNRTRVRLAVLGQSAYKVPPATSYTRFASFLSFLRLLRIRYYPLDITSPPTDRLVRNPSEFGILESSDTGPSRADLAMAHGSRLSRTAPSLGEVPMTFIPGSRVPRTRTIILMYSTASAPMLNPKRHSIAQRTDTVHSFFSGQPALTSCNRTSCGDALRSFADDLRIFT